jgi:hypothetical protein
MEVGMKICGVCGHEIKDEAVFCPNCGSRCEEPAYVAQDGGAVDGGNAQGDVDCSQNQQNVQPNQQYAQPNQQYAQPNQQYAQPNQQYAQPNQQYAQSNQPYGQPNPQYGFGYGQGYGNGNGYNQGYAQNYGYNATASRGAPEEPLSVGSWMLTMLVLTIPVANLVMLFVWAFGEGNRGRKNFCRASLIYVAISIVIYIVFIVLMLVVFGASAVSSSTGYY